MSDSNFHLHDELEQHLRADLSDYAPEATDELWAGIEARLPAGRRRRPLLFWWLTGVSVAAILTAAVYRFVQNTQGAAPPIEHTLVHQDEEVLKSQEQTKTATKNPPLVIPLTKLRLKNPQASNSGSAGKQSRASSILVDKADTDTRTLNIISTGNDPAMRGISPEIATFSSDVLAQIQPLYTLPIDRSGREILSEWSLLKKDPAPPNVQPLHFPAKIFRTHPWQIGFTAAPVWIWQPARMDDPYHIGKMAFVEHQQGPASGWQKGVSLDYQFAPHWRLSTGLSHRKTAQMSSHNATLRLIDGTCINPNDPGPKEYEFQYALQSGGSGSSVTVRIAQVDTMVTMPADEPFMLIMSTTRSSTDWVLPLTVQRTFGRNRWQGFVQAGGQLDLPAQTDVQVEHFTEECIDLCFATGRIPTLTLTEHRKASVSWLLGVGLECRIASRWGLSLEPTFFGKKGQTGLSLNAGLNFKL